ncbi:unnamed protein product [Cuscuta campestris]|uniref:Uncharacterized protein n=1 Tax=Cuscuta campestris TaxID=132261 RepID=A0A484M2I7_9ASTE|nr:unnamed protein product [Cuscuta campestris]
MVYLFSPLNNHHSNAPTLSVIPKDLNRQFAIAIRLNRLCCSIDRERESQEDSPSRSSVPPSTLESRPLPSADSATPSPEILNRRVPETPTPSIPIESATGTHLASLVSFSVIPSLLLY